MTDPIGFGKPTPLVYNEKASVVTRFIPGGGTEYYLDHKGIRTRHATYEEAKKLADKANAAGAANDEPV